MIINNKEDWKKLTIKNLKIYYLLSLDGGGSTFGLDFIPVVKKLFKEVDKICEFGCGPGFIGFSLLAHGLCKKLILTDVNPLAIKACRKTIKENHLEDCVSTFVSDVLDDIPRSETWDLVVSNPPHFFGSKNDYKKSLILIDPNWEIHKKFYRNISQHLNKNGSVLFVENIEGSKPNMWKTMIGKSRLKYIRTFWFRSNFYRRIALAMKLLFSMYGINIIHMCLYLIRNKEKLMSRISNKRYPFYFVWSKKISGNTLSSHPSKDASVLSEPKAF